MRRYSLAYLSAHRATVPEFIDIASQTGYECVGLRLRPNLPGAPFQSFIDEPNVQRETLARLKNTGVQVFDIEIIRIGPQFNPHDYISLLEAGAALGAKAVLVASDDDVEPRFAENYAKLCEFMKPYGLSADLEFMPWTGIKNAKAAVHAIQSAGSPGNAGLLVDALHFGRSTTTLEDLASIPKDLMHYAQICDAEGGVDFTVEEMIQTAREDRLLPGEGTIDLVGLFSALPNTIPISVEIPNFKRSGEIGEKAWAQAAIDATKLLLRDS
jgi:sugar phosphate isomerase/epimerase